MSFFPYGTPETEYLKKRDPRLGAVIGSAGMIRREMDPDPFGALLKSIVGQQISGKAASTVWDRLLHRLGAIAPETVAAAGEERLAACGMSRKKAGYLTAAAAAALRGEVDFGGLSSLSDREVVARLTVLPGVGVWTAEMLLLFSLGRRDIVSFGDFGIRMGMRRVYGLSGIDRRTFEELRGVYSPYGSVASLYLWAAAKGEGAAP
jgi:DNA-3-methyladenine glycosylase II